MKPLALLLLTLALFTSCARKRYEVQRGVDFNTCNSSCLHSKRISTAPK